MDAGELSLGGCRMIDSCVMVRGLDGFAAVLVVGEVAERLKAAVC